MGLLTGLHSHDVRAREVTRAAAETLALPPILLRLIDHRHLVTGPVITNAACSQRSHNLHTLHRIKRRRPRYITPFPKVKSTKEGRRTGEKVSESVKIFCGLK